MSVFLSAGGRPGTGITVCSRAGRRSSVVGATEQLSTRILHDPICSTCSMEPPQAWREAFLYLQTPSHSILGSPPSCLLQGPCADLCSQSGCQALQVTLKASCPEPGLSLQDTAAGLCR